MHLTTAIPISLSFLGAVLAQAPTISINVAGQGAAPAATPPPPAGAPPPAPAAPGAPAAITINPQGVGAAAVPPAAPGVAPPAALGAAAPGLLGTGRSQSVWVVKVGSQADQMVFSPNTMTAQVGEFVQFQFYAKNHSVVSSTFEQPCVPNTSDSARAFFSGFMPTEEEGKLTYTVAVKDTQPIWFYSSQERQCQEGMVGVINPPATGAQTLAQYQAAAATAPENITPQVAPNPQPQSAGEIGATPTASGALAQGTRSAGTIVRKASWELAGGALVAWLLL